MYKQLSVAAALATPVILAAQTENDSLQLQKLNEVVVMGVRVKADAPFAVSNINRETLDNFSRTGQELPFLFSRTPGVLAWSENGVGTGTTYMRIRGAGDSRINVTLDGVPLNSPEDQCVFWANMNSYGALLANAQIQRGVGTSTNGDGAFGGTISLTTRLPSFTPGSEISYSYGSYNTCNARVSFSTGLLFNHILLEGAYHRTETDGFLHGTDGRSGSYLGGLTYINSDESLVLRYKNIGNYETTGQAWNGVTAGNDDYSMNSYDGIRTYNDMYRAGLGRFNSLYEQFIPDWQGGYETKRYEMTDGTLWPHTTDNFWQNHNILSAAWQINDNWSATTSLHYTHGHGYYREFRYNNKLKKFGLANFTDADGSTVKKADFIRKKGLTQDTYGIVSSINYSDARWNIISGLSMQDFESGHYGYLTYTSNPALAELIGLGVRGDYRYYDSNAQKSDANIYVKATYHIAPSLDAFADLQYRHVHYMTDGINDKFYANPDGTYSNQILDINKKYDFFNPKAGLSYHTGGFNAYISYALSHREPERNNFTDNGNYPAPRAEMLHDLESGAGYQAQKWQVQAGLYAMLYDNQFVQTGQQSDIGESLTTNIHRSYRLGAELSAGWSPLRHLSLEGNAALSINKIRDFDEVVETYDDSWNDLGPTVVSYSKRTLAFSPSAILNGFITFSRGGFRAVWNTRFVSRQYIDNTQNRDRSLPAYSTSGLDTAFELKKAFRSIKSTTLTFSVNNIFNRHYASSAWVYSAIVGNDYPESGRYYQIGYIPMAGTTVTGSITLKF